MFVGPLEFILTRENHQFNLNILSFRAPCSYKVNARFTLGELNFGPVHYLVC